ncbi:MAG: class D sortase [Paludibacteraceae bacterium]|nr:class D sortase [Paludibacteraceae bacterium]
MKNKKFIVLLIALIALIALIFTVAFLAGRDNKPVDHSAPTPTETIMTEEPTETNTTTEPTVTGNPDMTPGMTFNPWETGLPYPTPSVPGPVVTNPPVVRTTPKPTSALHTSPVYGQAFTLTILGTNIPVSIGVDNATLDKTPGWLETSAYPGEEGVCVIYGHRNRNHFQVLKDVDFGDTITVTLADGTVLNYTVESIRILDPDEELRVPLFSGQHLMLTTCYPFYYTGHAPQKFILIASKVS